MEGHLDEEERSTGNRKNGKAKKLLKTSSGNIEVSTPHDRHFDSYANLPSAWGKSYSVSEWQRKIGATPTIVDDNTPNSSVSNNESRSNSNDNSDDNFPRVVGAYGIVIKEGLRN